MDLVTHLPLSRLGHAVIATFVDRMTKMTYFVPCSTSITAPALA